MQTTPELIKKLRDLAARETWTDDGDFDPQDYSGGNFDDAYDGGREDGQTELAREIIGELDK